MSLVKFYKSSRVFKDTMNYKYIELRNEDDVMFLIFNRPEKKNALSPEMHVEINDAVSRLMDDRSFRVLVLTGNGDSFCAGQDLQKFFKENYDKPFEYEKFGKVSSEWGEKLRLFPKPTIAMVNGWCVGAGLRIMALCDLAVASQRATFVLSEINFGLIPAGGVSKATTELIPFRDAMYMALTGEKIGAEEANRMRLVNTVVPHDKLREETMRLADKLKQKDPVALMMTKLILKKTKNLEYPSAVEYELLASHRHSYLQKDEWVRKSITYFLEGKFKPGMETYKKEQEKER
jgi:trans-feruloyl-CoA hydratase/vanillin synthase